MHFNDLSTDAQKFAKTLWSVLACEPTAVRDEQVLSMAVAVHVRKCETISYEYKDLGSLSCICYNAWHIWQSHSKWIQPTAHGTGDSVDVPAGSGANDSAMNEAETPIKNVLAPNAVKDNQGDSQSVQALPAGRKLEEHFGMGAKNGKLVWQKELQTQKVWSMADSAEHMLDVSEELYSIAPFSFQKAAELLINSQFFAVLRKAYFTKEFIRVLVPSSKFATFENVANDDSSTALDSARKEGTTTADMSSAPTGS